MSVKCTFADSGQGVGFGSECKQILFQSGKLFPDVDAVEGPGDGAEDCPGGSLFSVGEMLKGGGSGVGRVSSIPGRHLADGVVELFSVQDRVGSGEFSGRKDSF